MKIVLSFSQKVRLRLKWLLPDDTFNDIMGSWSEEENPLKDTFLVQVDDIT